MHGLMHSEEAQQSEIQSLRAQVDMKFPLALHRATSLTMSLAMVPYRNLILTYIFYCALVLHEAQPFSPDIKELYSDID